MKNILSFFKKLFNPIDLTKGSIYKSIILFMLPIVFSYIFQQIYTLSDAIIVGQNLSAAEVNGINDVGSLNYIFLQFAFGCGAGFSVISSNRIGENDLEGVKKSFIAQIILGLIIGVILTLLGIFLLDPLLSLVGLTSSLGGSTYTYAKQYLFIIFLGTICQLMYNQIVSLLRSIGDSFTPLIFLIASTILNILLDLLFIVTFKWGVQGAAFATILAQGISAILCFIYTFKKYKFLRFGIKEFKTTWKESFAHLKMGLPLAFQFSILGIGLITMQNTIIRFDKFPNGSLPSLGDAQLAYGAVNKIQTFLMCPLNALGTAMLSFVAQCKGANDIKRIKKGITASLVIMLVIYLLDNIIAFLLLIDDSFLKIFYSTEEITDKVIQCGRLNILSTIPLFFLLGILFILRNAIQGMGKSLFPFLAGISELVARVLICLYGPYLFTNIINNAVSPFSNPYPFIVTYLADPLAWLFATIILLIGYYLYIYKPYKIEKNNEIIIKNS